MTYQPHHSEDVTLKTSASSVAQELRELAERYFEDGAKSDDEASIHFIARDHMGSRLYAAFCRVMPKPDCAGLHPIRGRETRKRMGEHLVNDSDERAGGHIHRSFALLLAAEMLENP